MIDYSIDEDWAGVRLDKFLRKKLSSVPVSHLFKMVRTKKVKVNGRRAQPEQLLARGDQVTVRGDGKTLSAPHPVRAEGKKVDPSALDVLYEDEQMMAINKPAGMAVHPGSGIRSGTVVDYARAYLGAKAARNGFMASPAHRLDRETSGVLLVAKRRPAMVHFTDVFTRGKAKKRYLTLVKGRMPRRAGTIDTPLSEHQQTRASKERRGVNLQPAITRYKVLEQGGEVAFLECQIDTGRTHQIRRHMASIGHPIVGDKKYGDFDFNRKAQARWGLKRLFLHAGEIDVPDPATGLRLKVVAPFPLDLNMVLHRSGLADYQP